MSNSYKHSMAEADESPSLARRRRDNFIAASVAIAKNLAGKGEREGALSALGGAFHAIMDSYSPEHVDASGNPKVWEGVASKSAIDHARAEAGEKPTQAQQKEMSDRLTALYNQVFPPK